MQDFFLASSRIDFPLMSRLLLELLLILYNHPPPCLLYFPPSFGHLSCYGLGFLWLNIALNRCSALEQNTPPLLAFGVRARVRVRVCVRLSAVTFSSIIIFPSCSADSDSAAKQ